MSNATADVLRVRRFRKAVGFPLKTYVRSCRINKVAGRGIGSARGGWSDVTPLLRLLQALRQCPLAWHYCWPDDEASVGSRRVERAAAKGASRVRIGMLSPSICSAIHAALDGSIRPLPVLIVETTLPVSVLPDYTTKHGSTTDSS